MLGTGAGNLIVKAVKQDTSNVRGIFLEAGFSLIGYGMIRVGKKVKEGDKRESEAIAAQEENADLVLLKVEPKHWLQEAIGTILRK